MIYSIECRVRSDCTYVQAALRLHSLQYKSLVVNSRITEKRQTILSSIFLLINVPGAVQIQDRKPIFCTQFAEQKVCLVLYFFLFYRFLSQNINQIRGRLIKYCYLNQQMFIRLSLFKFIWQRGSFYYDN